MGDIFRKLGLRSVLARNTGYVFLGSGLRLVIQALYFIEIARSLGASKYGAFIGVVALVGVAYPFADLGSGNLLVKNVSRDRTHFAAYWGRALVTTACFGSFLLALVLVVSHFVLPANIPIRLVILIALSDILGLSTITTCAQAFLAVERLNWTATLNVLISASRLIGATVLIGFTRHPSALQWGYVYFASTAVVTAISCLLVWSKLGPPTLNWRRSIAEIREGCYFSASLSAQTIYNDIDKTMLARLGSLDATGIYGAAYRLIDVSFAPVSSLLMASYAQFFRSGAEGITSCLKYAKPLLLRSIAYSVLICAILIGLCGSGALHSGAGVFTDSRGAPLAIRTAFPEGFALFLFQRSYWCWASGIAHLRSISGCGVQRRDQSMDYSTVFMARRRLVQHCVRRFAGFRGRCLRIRSLPQVASCRPECKCRCVRLIERALRRHPLR